MTTEISRTHSPSVRRQTGEAIFVSGRVGGVERPAAVLALNAAFVESVEQVALALQHVLVRAVEVSPRYALEPVGKLTGRRRPRESVCRRQRETQSSCSSLIFGQICFADFAYSHRPSLCMYV